MLPLVNADYSLIMSCSSQEGKLMTVLSSHAFPCSIQPEGYIALTMSHYCDNTTFMAVFCQPIINKTLPHTLDVLEQVWYQVSFCNVKMLQ